MSGVISTFVKRSSTAVLHRPKRGSKVGKTKRGKGTQVMAVADRSGLPVAVCIESASPHEVKLVDRTLVQMVIREAPQNLIGDAAYDSDKLDTELKAYGIEPVAPHRENRKNKTQDGRRLRRLRRRWKIEAVCMATELPKACCPLRASCRKLSGYATSRLLPDPIEEFMR